MPSDLRRQDVHRATAAEVFDLPLELDDVSADQRRSAKAINFGSDVRHVGIRAGKQLGIPRNEAQEYIDLYFDRYPGVKAIHGSDDTREQRETRGYRRNRVRPPAHLPEINARNARRSAASTPNAARSMRRCRARPPTSSSAR